MNAHTDILAEAGYTQEVPACVAEARLAARRLKAAARRSDVPWKGRRCREIGHRLSQARRKDERAIIAGPYPYLSMLHSFMRDWREAIDMECRPVPLPSVDLNNLRKGHRASREWLK